MKGLIKIRIWEILPESLLKDEIRCYYWNHFAKTNFNISRKNNHFQFKFRNGITFKSYYSIISTDIAIPLKGYFAKYKLKKGDFVIDCGAFLGAFTMYASKIVGDTGIVIAFEPDTLNYKKLTDNIKLNKLTNVITLNKGVWSKNTTLKFNNKNSEESSLFFNDKTESVTDVHVVTLDDELEERGIKKVDFIKMNIEGAEIEAVKGARKILKNNDVNLVVASNHIVNGEKTCFELKKLFSKLGYKAETAFPEHLTTYAEKQKGIKRN